MQGKTVLITGATDGIGLVATRELARLGATVVAVGRNADKTAAVVERIRLETGNPRVEGMLADLSSQRDIHRLVQQFRERHDRLHVLLNNAGALFHPRRESVDGIEMTFALNHLGYFLLTNLLLDVLKASAPARIINVSSAAHRRAKLNFDDLQYRRRYRGMGVYSASKLANLLFTYELARRLQGTGVTVNALHPGLVATRFAVGSSWVGRVLRGLIWCFGISPEQGARTLIYLASSPEVEGVTGKYFQNEKMVESSPASRNEDAARRLWDISEVLTQRAI
ncbi:MAG TPA: SDR family oxidoreductase [Gemmataceae bacterium]|nr:SDR family oxidoreductase [Gemmataceae bacterium]